MPLNPLPDRGPLVQAGMDYFSGKDIVNRRKKKAQATIGQNKAKLTNQSLSPVPQFRTVPSYLSNPSSLGRA